MAVIHQVMRQGKTGGPQPDHQHLVTARRLGQRTPQVERVPTRQQAVNLEAPRQRQHVLQILGLDLRNVDRLLLLIDAGLHAVVADAVAGRGDHRIVDDCNRQRADGVAARLHQIHLGDFFFERATGQGHAKHAFLERPGLAILETARTGILALVVTPDAVIGVIERAFQIHAGIGERESVAEPVTILRQAQHGDAVLDDGLDRDEMFHVEPMRHFEQHALAVPRAPVGRQRRPGRVSRRDLERLLVGILLIHPNRDMPREGFLGQRLAEPLFEIASRRVGVDRRRLLLRHAFHGAALHEQTLYGVKRRQCLMPRLQRARLFADAEQLGDEILEMRRQVDQQFGFDLGFELGGIAPPRHHAIEQINVARFNVCDKRRVELFQPVAAIQIFKTQPVPQGEVGHDAHCLPFGPAQDWGRTQIWLARDGALWWRLSAPSTRCFMWVFSGRKLIAAKGVCDHEAPGAPRIGPRQGRGERIEGRTPQPREISRRQHCRQQRRQRAARHLAAQGAGGLKMGRGPRRHPLRLLDQRRRHGVTGRARLERRGPQQTGERIRDRRIAGGAIGLGIRRAQCFQHQQLERCRGFFGVRFKSGDSRRRLGRKIAFPGGDQPLEMLAAQARPTNRVGQRRQYLVPAHRTPAKGGVDPLAPPFETDLAQHRLAYGLANSGDFVIEGVEILHREPPGGGHEQGQQIAVAVVSAQRCRYRGFRVPRFLRLLAYQAML